MKEEHKVSSRRPDRVSKAALFGLAWVALVAAPAAADAGVVYSGLLNSTGAYQKSTGRWTSDVVFGYPGEKVTLSSGSASSTRDETTGVDVTTGFELGLTSWDMTRLAGINPFEEPYSSWTFADIMAFVCTDVQVAGWFDSVNNEGYATRLSAGDSIGGGLAWLTVAQSQAGATLVDYGNDHGSISNNGAWVFAAGANDADGYVGLAFLSGGNIYYGWAHVSASIDQDDAYASYTLIDWAYNDVAGESIVAGDTGASTPVPEPGSVLLLGSGLVGLARFGKRLRK